MAERAGLERKRARFLWGDLGVNLFAMICFWYTLKEAERWLSFGGFGALFMILIYDVCIGFLLVSGICIALCIRRGQRGFLMAASVCQGLVALGWFCLWKAIPSLWSWTETGSLCLAVIALVGLLRSGELFPGRKKAKKSGLYTAPEDDI